jgi:hypothetical protein
MVVVVHQHVGMQVKGKAFHALGQQFQKMLAVIYGRER